MENDNWVKMKNTRPRRGNPLTLSIYRGGHARLRAGLIEHLGLKAGDRMDIFHQGKGSRKIGFRFSPEGRYKINLERPGFSMSKVLEEMGYSLDHKQLVPLVEEGDMLVATLEDQPRT